MASSAPSSRLAMRGREAAPSRLPKPTRPTISAIRNWIGHFHRQSLCANAARRLAFTGSTIPTHSTLNSLLQARAQTSSRVASSPSAGASLYQNGQVIGGLGVSGDSSCADHAIAYRMRKLAGFDGTPAGPNGSGAGAHNIIY